MRVYIPDGYEISGWRYKELLALCRQYDELRRKRNDCYDLGAPVLSDLPRSGAKTSVVERKAEQAQKYAAKIDRIEKAARQASEGVADLYKCLLKNVSGGIPYEHLNCPCGRRQFYEMRRRFFFILDKS